MRKVQKDQLTDALRTLTDAHSEIEWMIQNEKPREVTGLLSVCQEMAGRLLDFVEELEGEGSKTALVLEEYYKTLYDMSANPLREDAAGRLRDYAARMAESVRKDIRADKIEVLFLPYKASMWDSMESVWRAAEADPDCDAFVVPIPYYERGTGQSLENMVYEGYKYPSYVPVTGWEEYEPETRRPDIIVIHNPYDGANFTTAAHPKFHAEKLAGYADLLVYIPYFAEPGEGQEHFARTPGVLYADRVVLQSEAVRRTYIKAFGEWTKGYRDIAKSHPIWGKITNPEEKFIALGSPKFDKIFNSREEDFDLPEAWRGIIYKDGAKRPAVLYNTGFTNMNAEAGARISKLKHVLNVFKNQEKAALWWRPHPLSEASLKSMRREYLEEYKNIVENYKREGWGIYDDTPDLHRSLRMTSCLYGEWTSLTPMYQYTENPVLMQNAYVDGGEGSLAGFMPDNILDAGGKLWFTDRSVSGLFLRDKETGETEYMRGFSGFGPRGVGAYNLIAEYNGKLYLAPLYADNIGVFDIKTREFKEVKAETSGFSEVLVIKGTLYFISALRPAVLVYEPEIENVSIIEIKGISSGGFGGGVFDESRGRLVLACSDIGAVVELNPETREVKTRGVDGGHEGYADINVDGGLYWLSLNGKAAIASYAPSSGEIREYAPDLELAANKPFQRIVRRGDSGRLALFPESGPALRFDARTGGFSLAEEFEAGFPNASLIRSSAKDKAFIREIPGGRVVGFAPYAGEKIRIEIKHSDIINPERIKEDIFNHGVKHIARPMICAMVENSRGVALEDVLDALTAPGRPVWLKEITERQAAIREAFSANSDGSAGAAIYAHCKSAVMGARV